MKLLFIIHNIANCGAERVLAILVNELACRGHNVYVLTQPSKVTYQLDSRVVLLDAYEGTYTYTYVNKFKKFWYGIANGWTYYKNIKKHVESINPDGVISFLGLFIWQLLAFRKKYKIVISDHTAMDRRISRKRDFERHYLPKLFYKYAVLTESDKNYLVGKIDNVVVMNNPLTFKPISRAEYDSLFGSRNDILVCASVDRYKVKGIDTLIKSFSIIANKYPEWHIDVAGEGSEENVEKLQKLARQNNIEKQIRFLGFSTHVDELMKQHSLLVLSSRVEGFGMVVTEAMANGCPTISFSLSGPKEIINNNVDGVLVENQNIKALSRAIEKMLDSKESRYVIGKNALESVQRFSVKNIVDRWEAIFQ